MSEKSDFREFIYDPAAFRERHVNSCLEMYQREHERFTNFELSDIDQIIRFIENDHNKMILRNPNDPLYNDCLEHLLKRFEGLLEVHWRLKVAKHAIGKHTKNKEILAKNRKAEIEF